ncbi:MAG: hypothetical protein RXR31_08100 [Thermoproteota archaeon]
MEENIIGFKNNVKIIKEKIENKRRNKENLDFVKEAIENLMNKLNVEIACITGSFTHEFSFDKDIDLMFVSENDKLWINLFKCFVITRAWKIKGLKLNFCVTYAVTRNKFINEIIGIRDPLVMHDLLKALPIKGKDKYYGLLILSPKIKEIFEPNFNIKNKTIFNEEKSNPFFITFNIIFYIILFIYLNIKKMISNLHLIKNKSYINVFTLKIGISHYMINSLKYEILKRKFKEIFI